MAKIAHPTTDLAPLLDEINRRLASLESNNPIPNATVLQNAGFAAGAPNSMVATANTSTWADFSVSNSFTFTITVPSRVLYYVYTGAKTTGGSGQVSYIRGNIVGFDVTAGLIYDKNNTGWINGIIWYFAGPTLPGSGAANFLTIPPGTYTAKLQGATDSGQTLTLNQFFHQIFIW